MTTFEFDDNLRFDNNDIMDQKAIEPFQAGEYSLILTEFEPKAENSKQDGYNMVVSLEITDDEKFSGLGVRAWFPWPKPGDESKKAGITTETIKSAKMRRIRNVITALGGTITKRGFEVPDGALCKACLIPDKWERKDMDGNPSGEFSENIKIQGELMGV